MAYELLACHLFNEAGLGNGPSTVFDDTGNDNNCAIKYSSGDAVWVNTPEGNGIDFIATVNNSNTAVVVLDDIKNNGNLGTQLNGATAVSFRVVAHIRKGHDYGMRVFAIGTSSGDTDISLIANSSGQLAVRWDMESNGGEVEFGYAADVANAAMYTIMVDTSEALVADRIKLKVNGVFKSKTGGDNIALNSALNNINSTNRKLTYGNRDAQNRNPEVAIYYGEIGLGVFSEDEQDDWSILLANNDESLQTETGTEQNIVIVSGSQHSDSTLLSIEQSFNLTDVSGSQLSDSTLLNIEEVFNLASIDSSQLSDSTLLSIEELFSLASVSGSQHSDSTILVIDSDSSQSLVSISSSQLSDSALLNIEEVFNLTNVIGSQLSDSTILSIEQSFNLAAITSSQHSSASLLAVVLEGEEISPLGNLTLLVNSVNRTYLLNQSTKTLVVINNPTRSITVQ